MSKPIGTEQGKVVVTPQEQPETEIGTPPAVVKQAEKAAVVPPEVSEASREAAKNLQAAASESPQKGLVAPIATAAAKQSSAAGLGDLLAKKGIIDAKDAAGAVRAGRLSDRARAAVGKFFAENPAAYAKFYGTLGPALVRDLPKPDVVAAGGAGAATLFSRATFPADALVAWMDPTAVARAYMERPDIKALNLDITGKIPMTDEQVDGLLAAVGADNLSHFVDQVLLPEDSGVELYLQQEQLAIFALQAAIAGIAFESFSGLISHIHDPHWKTVLNQAYLEGQKLMTPQAGQWSPTTRFFVLDADFKKLGIDLAGDKRITSEQVQGLIEVADDDLPTFVTDVLVNPDSGVTLWLSPEGFATIGLAAGRQGVTAAQLEAKFKGNEEFELPQAMRDGLRVGAARAEAQPAPPSEPVAIMAQQLEGIGIDPTGQRVMTFPQFKALVGLIGQEKVTPFVEQMILSTESPIKLKLDDDLISAFALIGGLTDMSQGTMRRLSEQATAPGRASVDASWRTGRQAKEKGANPVSSE